MCGDRFSSSTTCSRWRHETGPGRLDQSLSCRFWKVATHPRRRFGFLLPWRFLLKVGSIAGVMGVVVGALSARWPASPLHVVALVVLGAAIFVLGLRVARVLGPEEIELVERTRLPGSRWLIAWCAAGR